MKSGLDATPLFLLDDLLKKKHIAVKAFCRVVVEFGCPRYLNTTTMYQNGLAPLCEENEAVLVKIV